MTDQPSLMTKLMARLSGEVDAETLDAYRRAGLGVYDLLASAEARRADLAEAEDAEVDAGSRCFLLCTWNAFALQTLGDAFVAADYEANPRTIGYVPPVTKEQALAFFGEVERWMSHARRAEADPGCRVDVELPAELPPFAEVEPCPREHLQAMLAAAGALRAHAETALVDAERLPGGERSLAELRQVLAGAATASDYAQRLYGEGDVAQELHERIEESVKEALVGFYLAGQIAAMPELAGRRPVAASVTGAGRRLPGPGEPGFDPWCLTDPRTRAGWQRDRKAVEAIETLWDHDPDPAATLELQAEVEEALRRGYLEIATGRDGRPLGNFYCCPWSPIYVTTCPLVIGGRRLRAGQQLTLDVSAEEMGEGGPFKRELLLGSFSPTDRIDYCDPREGGHDD